MGALRQLLQIVCDTLVYLGTFMYFSWWQQPISKLEVFGKERLPVCHVYTLAQTLQLWDAPHYRASSFAEDLRANLRNVAIPGTGIPLSIFCYNKATALFFILVVNPLISLAAAAYLACHKTGDGAQQQQQQQQQQPASVAATYRRLLLFPDHWFAIWRHNCMLVGYHALLTGSSSYAMESKGTWLLEGQRLGLPVSPFYSDGTVFVKHVSIEGGMGIYVFRSFAQGGEWVIQRALHNSASLSRMLPPGAPLSTLRVVTASTAWLDQQQQEGRASTGGRRLGRTASGSSSGQLAGGQGGLRNGSQPGGRLTPELPLSAGVVQQQQQQQQRSPADDSMLQQRPDSSNGSSLRQAEPAAAGGAAQQQQQQQQQQYAGQVRVVTAVWRAGLAGKDTDHSSICFPLDPQTGVLAAGRTSNHWYKLGLLKWLGRVPAEAGRTWLTHPDSGVAVAGAAIPDVPQVMRTVMHAHMVATPDVPLVGWDVALTPEGVYLLELNISCNLFRGAFDSAAFYESMFQHFVALEELEALGK